MRRCEGIAAAHAPALRTSWAVWARSEEAIARRASGASMGMPVSACVDGCVEGVLRVCSFLGARRAVSRRLHVVAGVSEWAHRTLVVGQRGHELNLMLDDEDLDVVMGWVRGAV